MHILSATALLLLNIRYKTWRSLGENWLGVVYVVAFNGLFYLLSSGMKPLPWEFNSRIMKPKALRYLQLFVIMPLLTLLYLANKPSTIGKKITYMFQWTIGSAIIETIGHKINAISFYQGWNMKWSTLLYIKMYTYAQLILVSPLFTLGLSALSTCFFALKFNVPGLFFIKNRIKSLY